MAPVGFVAAPPAILERLMLAKSDYFSRRILSCLFAIPQREGRVKMRRAKQETNLFFFFFFLVLGATGREVQIVQRRGGKKKLLH